MSTTATTADPDQPQPPLLPSSIPIIDLRLLSQSDLYTLSTSSIATSSSPNNHNNRPDDVIIPKIDKTVFNESAGSRKQTYSKLRLAPPLSATSSPSANMRRRHSLKYAPVTLSSSNEVTVSESSNELAENSEIVSVLKGLFMSRSRLGDDVIVEEDDVTVKEKESEVVESDDVVMSPEPVTAVLPKEEESTETKKKRGRPRKSESGNVDGSAVLASVSESVAKRAKAAEEEEKKRKSESGNVGESAVLVSVSESVAKRVKAAEEEEKKRKSESGNVGESAVLVSVSESVAKRVKEDKEEEVVMSPEPVTAVLPDEEEMMESTETKKKRGRPRKSEGGNGNEVLVSAASVAKRVRARARESSVMKVVEDYDRDKDKEVVNSKGERVDLVKLGELDDPYGPEIQRRTEGMSSVEELLEFFRGLNGQWGTTRKKRRVVDASEFGDCLPKGWRLSLCIKKKDGRVWVFCRRYIRFGFRFSYVYDMLLDVDSYMDDVMFKASNDAICI